MSIEHGYILTSYLEQGGQGIDIVYFGKASWGPFKLIIPGQKHVFFIPQESKFDPTDFTYERKSGPLKSFNQKPVDAIYLHKLADINKAKRFCEQQGVRSYEMDVPLAERFLMERFIFSAIEFQGEFQQKEKVRVYHQPSVKAGKRKVELSKISIDIETGVGGELYSIAYAMEDGPIKTNNVLMLADKTEKIHPELHFYSTERELLKAFLAEFQNLDPDIIVGWHVIGFDLTFLENKCRENQMILALGRERDQVKLDFRQGAGHFANMKGRIVLDGPPVLRGAFYQFENFKLETVASEILGVGKDIASDENKVSEIERRFREDKEALAKYNLLDCTLVNDIFNKLKLVDLIQTRTYITGLVMDRINISTAAFDFIFLPLLHRKHFVAPNRSDIERDDASSGGLVMEPVPGLHRDVMVFDFKSLYPSIIRTFNICPYSLVQNQIDPISTPEGFQFSRSQGILPDILAGLFDKRQQAKDVDNKVLSQAIKILMNSFYGIMGSSRSRFYHADLPQAITSTGHFILTSAKDFFENRGFEVVYGDTDSLFVLGQGDPDSLAGELNSFFKRYIRSEFGVESQLECEFEKNYDQLFFPQARSGSGAAKKRYVGISRGVVEFKGMEAVRSDWTVLAKKFQRELYQRFFSGDEVEDFIRETITKLESRTFDQQLVYTKRLSKPAHEYTKNIPVHVKAAMKVNHKGPYPLKEVSYIMTKHGPEPIQNNPKDIDYPHYVEKQIRPIADDVLLTLGKNFESLRLGDQLSLF